MIPFNWYWLLCSLESLFSPYPAHLLLFIWLSHLGWHLMEWSSESTIYFLSYTVKQGPIEIIRTNLSVSLVQQTACRSICLRPSFCWFLTIISQIIWHITFILEQWIPLDDGRTWLLYCHSSLILHQMLVPACIAQVRRSNVTECGTSMKISPLV